jgi:hypothetical protein
MRLGMDRDILARPVIVPRTNTPLERSVVAVADAGAAAGGTR